MKSRFRTTTATAIWLTVTALPALAQTAYRYGACNGSYDLYSPGAMATAGALQVPVGTPDQTGVRITMGQCGREMVLEAEGMTVTLYQNVMDDRTYDGTLIMGDGVNRSIALRVGEDRNLRGALVASDPNMSVKRPLVLVLSDPQETRFEGCADDPATPFQPRGLTDEAAAVAQVLAEQGYLPAQGLSYGDYLQAEKTGPASFSVRLRLSRDNAVLPHPEIAAREMDPESAYCLTDESLDPTVRFLEFKVEYADDDPFVFARLVDLASSRITEQAEGVPATIGDGALGSGITDALTKLAPPITGMTDGVLR